MKRTIGLLSILLILVISLGHFFYKDGKFMNSFYKEFDTTLNIVTFPGNEKDTIGEIQRKASKNHISFIKEVYEPKNTQSEKQKINIYIFLNESKWFEKTFKSIRFKENNRDINRFDRIINISLLTKKKVGLFSFDKLDKNFFNGDYHLKGSQKDILNFIEELNSDKDLKVDSVIEPSFSLASEFTQKQVYLYLSFTSILFFALIFCFAIYNSSLTKEISVAKLLGYNLIEFSFIKVKSLLLIPYLASFLLVPLALYFLVKPESVLGFLFSLKEFFIIFIIVLMLLFLCELTMLIIKVRRTDITSSMKGKRRRKNKISSFFENFHKTIAIAVLLYLFVVSIYGLNDYVFVKKYISTWDKSINYANIACSWPWTYVEDDEKFEKIVVPKLNRLWNRLDEKGAVLFFSPNIKQEDMFYDVEYVNQQAFRGNYAFINENYLNINPLVDTNNNYLDEYKLSKTNGQFLFLRILKLLMKIKRK